MTLVLHSERYTRAQLLVPHHLMSPITIGRNAESEQNDDMKVSRQIDSFAQDGKWPLKSHRVMTFAKTPESDRLRKHHSLLYQHRISHLPLNKNGKRPKVKCLLCSNSTTFRQTSKECSSCRVPLCTQSIDGKKSCFTLWHEGDDLKVEHVRILELLKTCKAANPSQRKKRKCPELEALCDNIGECLDEGNNEGQWTNDRQNQNTQESDESVNNTHKDEESSDEELFSTQNHGVKGSDKKQCRLESCSSSEEEIGTRGRNWYRCSKLLAEVPEL